MHAPVESGCTPATPRRDPSVGSLTSARSGERQGGELEPRLDLLNPFARPGTRLLDLGCGQGDLALELARWGLAVTGFDISPAAVQVATKRAEQSGIPAVFLVADITEPLTVSDSSFEVVGAVLSLRYFRLETSARIVREIARVFTRGGLLCFYVNTLSKGQGRTERGRVSTVVEPGVVIELDGVTWRYFGEDDLQDLLRDWSVVELELTTIESLQGRAKSCWRVLARRSVFPAHTF
jgi:SAM-dependent methyltransferase